MADKKVRVRFAPSPTGPLHMGGVRTALYNYLFAKKHNGDFILRIEDTDQKRYVPGAEEFIVESLKWCGLTPDESPELGGPHGPYRQSERKVMYRKYADQLIESGHAYYAFDSTDELDARRKYNEEHKLPNWQYDSTTRDAMTNSLTLSDDEVQAKLDAGVSYTIRLKIPRDEDIRFEDVVRGWVVVNSSIMDDKVIFKADGLPTYHLANIVDDYHMAITHVIRGEEWLPSTPLHVLIYRYLGWEDAQPAFAHLPLILKPDGKGKLGKRDGARLGFPVFPLEWEDPKDGVVYAGYRDMGYFPAAFINMLAFLGWNPGTTQELFSMDELVEAFSLERVNKAGAKFDPDKTKWFNQQYLRMESNESLANFLASLLEKEGKAIDHDLLVRYCAFMKERYDFPQELMEGIHILEAPTSYDEKTIRKKWKERTPGIMAQLRSELEVMDPFTEEEIEGQFKAFLEREELGFGAVLPGFRVLVTGQGQGPSMFSIAALIGKEETLKRLDTGVEAIANQQSAS